MNHKKQEQPVGCSCCIFAVQALQDAFYENNKSLQEIELRLYAEELFAYSFQAVDNFGRGVGILFVSSPFEVLLGSRKSETTFLHKVMYEAHRFNILLGVTTHTVGTLIGRKLTKHTLPIAQGSLGDTNFLGDLFYRVIEF